MSKFSVKASDPQQDLVQLVVGEGAIVSCFYFKIGCLGSR